MRTNLSVRQKRQKNDALWTIFNEEIQNTEKKKVPLECIYGYNNREICERCQTLLVYSEEGFLTCTNANCGIVYKDLVNQTAEWRYYGAEDCHSTNPTRCGIPVNPLFQSSYGCKVLCSKSSSYEMKKIRRYTEWQSMPYKEKTQYDDFQFITIMAQNAGIPKIFIDDAIKYHKMVKEYDLTFRGLNNDGILAASIYISFRVNQYPRTAKEIASIFYLDAQSTTKGCKNAITIINDLEKNMDNRDKTDLGMVLPHMFIERYCSKLLINEELTKFCQFMSKKVEQMKWMTENTPPSIAAGIIYFVSQIFHLNICKHNIKAVSETSEVTINKCYKKLEKIMNTYNLIPQSLLLKYNVNLAKM